MALRRLEQWRSGIPAAFALDRSNAFPEQTLERPEMRSLASIYLRYDHAIITLLRPVFFKLMTSIIQGETDATFLDGHHELSVECIAAARCSLQILQMLAEADRIAKYGFWESLHIFSSLTITTLATLVNKTRPYSFNTSELDENIISNCNGLLSDMAAAGNLAARSHQKMLQDIENSLGPIFAGPDSQQVDAALQWADMEAELLQWADLFDEPFGLPSNDFLAFTPAVHNTLSASKE
ncbi:hypothetical protein PRZ48_014259 [Zasmidium cellare]|uniref:Uncharacterized protein n=1 Tax=Zasmidium cellare TaxID=395010 RepID=A0ABR0E102_ZASCE|nr:hypothetical protein PRZ48_014259 [Zasmidium cellare]